MAAEDDDDVYDDEYDFVDDEPEDDADDIAGEKEAGDERAEFDDEPARDRNGSGDEPLDGDAEEYHPPAPAANYVVHVYEHQKFKRTIDRPFTAEDAEAFASEYNRTAKPYGRFALAGKDDSKPRKTLE
jgi:hypothetical protein